MQMISMILSLLCGVALFLFGMSLMGDGLKRVAGNKLEIFLYRMTNTPLKGILLGINGTLLQADVDLREGHGSGIGFDALPELNVVFILHDTDLLSGDRGKVFIGF